MDLSGESQPALDAAAVVMGYHKRCLSPPSSARPPRQQINAAAAFRQRAGLEEAIDQRLMAGVKLLDESAVALAQMCDASAVGWVAEGRAALVPNEQPG